MIIYKITNKVNGKIYIGCTSRTMEQRLSGHFRQRFSMRGNCLGRAIIKYGIENFIIEKIEDCNSEKQMFEREIYWISFYNSTNNNIGYNLTEGGDTGPIRYGKDNARWGSKNIKLAELNRSRKGIKLSEEHKQKVIATMTGKKRSQETKDKMSIARKLAWQSGLYINSTDAFSKARKLVHEK